MAVSSSSMFSTFLCPISLTASPNSRPSSSLHFLCTSSPANLRLATTISCSTASEPATGKRGLRGIAKPRRVSPEMQALVGVPEIPRTQALKKIWAYIKEHNLQDPDNKKIIVCDDILRKIFAGKDRVGFLEIAGLITPHFLKE